MRDKRAINLKRGILEPVRDLFLAFPSWEGKRREVVGDRAGCLTWERVEGYEHRGI